MTPAMPQGRRAVHPGLFMTLNEGRGDDPGDACMGRLGRPEGLSALNEGRGDDPGDALSGRPGGPGPPLRSTKAGVMTPAMLEGCPHALDHGADAQRRPG